MVPDVSEYTRSASPRPEGRIEGLAPPPWPGRSAMKPIRLSCILKNTRYTGADFFSKGGGMGGGRSCNMAKV